MPQTAITSQGRQESCNLSHSLPHAASGLAGSGLAGRGGPQDTPLLPVFTPPMIELRKAVLPGMAMGEDPRLWPRLSFRLAAGKTLVIRADRDTGSAVLRLITRQAVAVAGVVCLGGRDIWLMSGPEISEQIGFADAGIPPDPEASLWQVMARAFLPPGCDWGEVKDTGQRRAISRALARMGLTDRAGTRCAALPPAGGLALVIARALLHQPRILLVDASTAEPAALPALDLLAAARGEDMQTSVIVLRSDQAFPDWAIERLDLCDGRF